MQDKAISEFSRRLSKSELTFSQKVLSQTDLISKAAGLLGELRVFCTLYLSLADYLVVVQLVSPLFLWLSPSASFS